MAPPPSPALKVLRYGVLARSDGFAFSRTEAGDLTALSQTQALLSLADRGRTTLEVISTSPFAMTATAQDFRVWTRFQGSLVMLCDAAGAPPAASLGRYALVAGSVLAGGAEVASVVDVRALAGRRFHALVDCRYWQRDGTLVEGPAPDERTVRLVFDAQSNATRSDILPGSGPYISVAGLDVMITGGAYDQRRLLAFRIDDAGTARHVLVERGFADEASRTPGDLIVWVEDNRP